MIIRNDAIFSQDDLLQIDNVLYEPKKDELIARSLVNVNTNWHPGVQEIGYDYYDRKGEATLLAAGGGARDVKFVSEVKGRETQKVFTIATGIKFLREELQAAQAARLYGNGPAISIDTLRVDIARRFIAEKENKIFFVGDSKAGIKGILNKTGITSENVALGATGGNDPAKRLWSNKTAQEILLDLIRAVEVVEGDGFFKARVLVLSPAAFTRLRRPLSADNSMTLLNWLNSEGMYFEKIVQSRDVAKTFNGDTVDYMLVFDNDPECVELAVPEDMVRHEPVFDILQNSEMAITERIAGGIFRYPKAIYVGKGIG
jgi:hypothetical protein